MNPNSEDPRIVYADIIDLEWEPKRKQPAGPGGPVRAFRGPFRL